MIIVLFLSVPILLGFAPKKNVEEPEVLHLPIIMYHKILNSKTGKYVVSEKQLEQDFKALNEAGYTTVFMSEVINWVDGKGKLPAKPVVITFDDGHYNNIYYGLQLAEEYGIKFMINPVTSFSKHTVTSGDHSNPNYSHITWDQMADAVASGHIEFGNHTHAMHKFRPRFGVMQMKSECFEEYSENFRRDIMESQNHFTDAGVPAPLTFAYPFGKYSKESRALLIDMGFRALLSCNEWVSKITRGKPECLHNLGRFNRDGHWSTEKLLETITS